MKAIRTDECNLTLTLPGAGPDRNLPAQRILAFDPERGQTEADAHPAIETTWLPDDGERRALANGAPVQLIIHGEQHPPVAMRIGEPNDLRALISKAHADRAIGYLFSKLSELMIEGKGLPPAAEIVDMWGSALEETVEKQPINFDEELEKVEAQIEEASAGGGHAIKNSLGHWYYGEDEFGEDREKALIFSTLTAATVACQALRDSLKQEGLEAVPVPPIGGDGDDSAEA